MRAITQTNCWGKQCILRRLISSRWDAFLEDVLSPDSHGRMQHTGKRMKMKDCTEMRQDDLMSLLSHKSGESRNLWKLAETRFPSLVPHMFDLIKPCIKTISLIFCDSTSSESRYCTSGNKTLHHTPIRPQNTMWCLRWDWPREPTWDSKLFIPLSPKENITENRTKQNKMGETSLLDICKVPYQLV